MEDTLPAMPPTPSALYAQQFLSGLKAEWNGLIGKVLVKLTADVSVHLIPEDALRLANSLVAAVHESEGEAVADIEHNRTATREPRP